VPCSVTATLQSFLSYSLVLVMAETETVSGASTSLPTNLDDIALAAGKYVVRVLTCLVSSMLCSNMALKTSDCAANITTELLLNSQYKLIS